MMTVDTGAGSTQGNQDRCESKLDRLRAPHVEPLNALVEQWRGEMPGRLIPWFDPDDAGICARVLVLMESPGPRTVRAGGSGFCSEDNDDGTARTFARLRRHAGLQRSAYLRWNIVPWAVHDRSGAWTAPGVGDLDAAQPALAQLLATLPALELVIVMGQRALAGYMRHVTVSAPERVLPVLATPHPSQRNTRSRDEAITRISNALAYAADLCPAY